MEMRTANYVTKVISMTQQLGTADHRIQRVSTDKPSHLQSHKETMCDQQRFSKDGDTKLVVHPLVQIHRLETRTCSFTPVSLPQHLSPLQ